LKVHHRLFFRVLKNPRSNLNLPTGVLP